MSETSAESHEFEHDASFTPGERVSSLGLGELEQRYQQLFADVLADGVITPGERVELERAAGDLGLDRQRVVGVEQAMTAAYEARHRVRIVEHYEDEPRSLAVPVDVGDAGRAMLVKRIEQLEARVRELEAELHKAQSSVNVEVDLGDVELAAESASEDPDQWWRRVRHDPTRPENYRMLYRIYDARGNTDARWCAAQALVSLQAATPAESGVFEAQRRSSLIAPKCSLSATDWDQLLLHPEQDLLTGRIFGVIAGAVLLGRATALRRDGKLHVPPPAARQDPALATITAVRALPWAAAILGVPTPPIYVEKDRDRGFEHIPALPPATVIGKHALSGLGQLEYAFLAGRHLSWYREEHYVKTLFSAIPELEDLFLAALTVGNPSLPIARDVWRRVAPIAQAISPVLQPAQLDLLTQLFALFVEQGGRTNLLRWSTAVERTACRAGLLLSGDLISACKLLAAEEGEHGDAQKDLLVFSVSPRYFELRQRLGVLAS